MKRLAMFVVAAGVLSLAGIVAQPLLAQSGSGESPGRIRPGAGPGGQGGGMGRYRGVDPDSIPSWKSATSDTVNSAVAEELPLVIWFMGEDESETSISDKDVAELSRNNKAVFIRVAFTEDREESPSTEESVVPTSKLLGDNPSREFDIPAGKGTVIVADSHGNEYYRVNSMPKADQLLTYFEKIQKAAEKQNEKLQKNLDKARSEVDDGDRRKALRYLLKNFDDGNGPVGLKAQEDSIRLYQEIMENVRKEVQSLVEKRDIAALKELQREVRKTDVEQEIDSAIEKLNQ